MPGNRPTLSLVPEEQDQVPRLVQFRTAHPEVVILMRGALPKAWVGGRKIEHPTLRGLLDELEEAFPPRAGSSSDRGPSARHAVTAGFDASVPNVARVYDYWLGGKDHYAADRAEAERLLTIYPPLRDLVRENRTFLTRAVSWAAGQGIGRFMDLGAGLPTMHNTHQAAQAANPAAAVAYVDLDPVVLSHARALLATGHGVAAVAADLHDPAAVLSHPELRATIDPAEPVCAILGAVLHFLDADTARAVTATYARLIAPGSYLVISCASYDDEPLAKRLAAEYTAATWHNHSRADVESFFAGLELTGPGVTEAGTWRAWTPRPVVGSRAGHVLAGVARKPRKMPGAAGAR